MSSENIITIEKVEIKNIKSLNTYGFILKTDYESVVIDDFPKEDWDDLNDSWDIFKSLESHELVLDLCLSKKEYDQIYINNNPIIIKCKGCYYITYEWDVGILQLDNDNEVPICKKCGMEYIQ